MGKSETKRIEWLCMTNDEFGKRIQQFANANQKKKRVNEKGTSNDAFNSILMNEKW